MISQINNSHTLINICFTFFLFAEVMLGEMSVFWCLSIIQHNMLLDFSNFICIFAVLFLFLWGDFYQQQKNNPPDTVVKKLNFHFGFTGFLMTTRFSYVNSKFHSHRVNIHWSEFVGNEFSFTCNLPTHNRVPYALFNALFSPALVIINA